MRVLWLAVASFLFIGFCVATTPTCDIFVSPTGSDTASCGLTKANPCRTIKEAVNRVSGRDSQLLCLLPSDTVSFECSDVFINNSIHIIGDNPASTIIDCKGSSRAFTISSGSYANVSLSGLTIANGNASEPQGGTVRLLADGDVYLRLKGCRFINNTGGAVSAMRAKSGGKGGSVFVDNCVFEGNSVGRASNNSDLVVHQQGGAISVIYGITVAVKDSAFLRNFANSYGGAISLEDCGDVVITGSRFYRNEAVLYSGGIHISNCSTTLIENSVIEGNSHQYPDREKTDCSGGGIQAVGNCIDIRNCTFRNNSGINGGGCYLAGNSITVTRSTFLENWAMGGGGGLCFASGSLALEGCHFYNNNAVAGGGMVVAQADLLSQDNLVENNAAISGGGTYFFTVNNSLHIHRDSYLNNLASVDGGGITQVGDVGNVFFEKVLFKTNHANIVGGGLSSSIPEITFLNTRFEDNTAPQEGSNLKISASSPLRNSNLPGIVFINSSFSQSSPPTQDGSEFNLLRVEAPTASFEGLDLSCPRGYLFLNSSFIGYIRIGKSTSIDFRCRPCSDNTYSLLGATITNGVLSQCNCTDCPDFARCHNASEVYAWPGYWCALEDPQLSLLQCYNCPEGNCKTESLNPWDDTCASNRDGVLCGDCLHGYGEAFGVEECVADEECHAAAWFFPILVLISLCFVGILLWFPINHHPLWKSATFFLQIVPLLVLGLPEESPVIGQVLAFFSLDPSILGISVSICLWPGMTSVEKMSSEYLLPLILLVELALLFAIQKTWPHLLSAVRQLIQRIRSECASQSEEEEGLLDGSNEDEAEEEIIVEHERTNDLSINNNEDEVEKGEGEGLKSDLEKKEEGDPILAHYLAALMGLLLFMYEGVTGATMNFLHCVSVDGQSVLFESGGVSCNSAWWHIALLVMVVVLAPLPLFLILLRKGLRRFEYLHEGAHAVLEVLEGPYALNRRWWESMGLLRRLALLALYTFLENPLWKAMGLFIGCSVMLVSHLFASPFAERRFDQMESVFLSCLVIIAALEIPFADHNWVGLVFEESPTRDALTYLQVTLIVLPILYGILVEVVVKRRRIVKWMLRVCPASWVEASVLQGREMSSHLGDFFQIEEESDQSLLPKEE